MTNNSKFTLSTAINKEKKPFPTKPWEDDFLGSEKTAKKLTDAVEDAARADIDNAYVIGLHGEWGTGKTFVLKRWCDELKLKTPSCVVVYYNAWEDDFLANPLVAIIARLQETMGSMGKLRATEGFEEKFVSVAKGVSKIANVYLGADVVEIILSTKEELEKFGNTGEVKRYLDLRKETDALKINLRDVAEVVKKETGFPLVFVIDELDRCRPIFALEVLERVKHLFNVPNVVFVLGMNKAGLQKSIQEIYGYDDAQSERYLRRFFDREVSMQFSGLERYCNYLLGECKVIEHLEQNSSFMAKDLIEIKGTIETKDIMGRFFVPMTDFLELTLREIEGLMGLLLDMLNNEKRGRGFRADLVKLTLCFMFIKVKNPALYDQVVAGEYNCKGLIDKMMKMFCNELYANFQYRRHFDFCQNTVEEQIYRLALTVEDEWGEIKQQMETKVKTDKEEPFPALAGRTKKSERKRVEQILELHKKYSDGGVRTVLVKDITSFIELSGMK